MGNRLREVLSAVATSLQGAFVVTALVASFAVAEIATTRRIRRGHRVRTVPASA